MNKEETLEAFKSCILTLRDKGKEFAENQDLYNAWKKETATVQLAVSSLNSEDRAWLEEEYITWFDDEFIGELDKLKRQ